MSDGAAAIRPYQESWVQRRGDSVASCEGLDSTSIRKETSRLVKGLWSPLDCSSCHRPLHLQIASADGGSYTWTLPAFGREIEFTLIHIRLRQLAGAGYSQTLIPARVLRERTFFPNLFPRALSRQSLFHAALFARL